MSQDLCPESNYFETHKKLYHYLCSYLLSIFKIIIYNYIYYPSLYLLSMFIFMIHILYLFMINGFLYLDSKYPSKRACRLALKFASSIFDFKDSINDYEYLRFRDFSNQPLIKRCLYEGGSVSLENLTLEMTNLCPLARHRPLVTTRSKITLYGVFKLFDRKSL